MSDSNLTVGELKRYIKDLPDDTPVYYQRIEDKYFDIHGWTTESVRWEGDWYTEGIRAFASYFEKESGYLMIHAHY